MFTKYMFFLFFTFVLINPSVLTGQITNNSVQGLTRLNNTSQVYHSKGYDIRAKTMLDFLSEAIAFYKSEYPEVAAGVNFLILDKKDWVERYSEFPYGVPFFDGTDNIIIPSDKFTASAELGYEDLSTDHEISEYDKFIISVLGQSYIVLNRNLNIPDLWLRDFLAVYFAVSFFEVNDFLWDLNPDTSEKITYQKLDDYNQVYDKLTATNYYWYQAKYIELSRNLFELGGFQMLTEILEYFRNNGTMKGAEEIISNYGEKELKDWKQKMK